MTQTPRTWLRSTPPPAAYLRPGGWRERAACLDHPTLPPSTWDDSLTADDGEARETVADRQARISVAKLVCRTVCPVRAECMAAVNLNWDEGVRGGEDLRVVRAALQRAVNG